LQANDPQQQALEAANARLADSSAPRSDAESLAEVIRMLEAMGVSDTPRATSTTAPGSTSGADSDKNDVLARLVAHPRVRAVAPMVCARIGALSDNMCVYSCLLR
jgi:hypothetical protein